DAALDTARELADALGGTPLLSVAAELNFGPDGVKPAPEALSLAERVQQVVSAPVAAGLHSLAAANLGGEEQPEEDALVCGDDALALAGDRDVRQMQAILEEAVRVVRERDGFVIAETRHGFVCGSAGVDASNAPEAGMLVLLPLEPDASAERIRGRIRELGA